MSLILIFLNTGTGPKTSGSQDYSEVATIQCDACDLISGSGSYGKSYEPEAPYQPQPEYTTAPPYTPPQYNPPPPQYPPPQPSNPVYLYPGGQSININVNADARGGSGDS